MDSWKTLGCGCVLALGLSRAGAAQDHDHGGGTAEQLGTVAFATSCNAAAQPPFNRAVALLHSFEFGRAIEGFKTALDADPSCAIAEWGIALSHWGNPFAAGIRGAVPLKNGHDAVERARARRPKSDRERAYVDARRVSSTRPRRHDRAARRVLVAYRDAMATVASRYPDGHGGGDLLRARRSPPRRASPADKTYASQLKAGAILEKLFAAQPDHPGLAHYIIHSYDVPALRRSRARGGAPLREDRARRRRTRCTCRRTPSRASATGRSRSTPTSRRRRRRAATASSARSCTRCDYQRLRVSADRRRTRRRDAMVEALAGDRRRASTPAAVVGGAAVRRHLRDGGDPGALRARARRLGRRGGAGRRSRAPFPTPTR